MQDKWPVFHGYAGWAGKSEGEKLFCKRMIFRGGLLKKGPENPLRPVAPLGQKGGLFHGDHLFNGGEGRHADGLGDLDLPLEGLQAGDDIG